MIDNIMTRDSEIPAIFNPKRVRAPSVVVTGESGVEGGRGIAACMWKCISFIGRCFNERFSPNKSITTEDFKCSYYFLYFDFHEFL